MCPQPEAGDSQHFRPCQNSPYLTAVHSRVIPCGSIPRLHQAAKTAAQYLVAWATTSYRRHQCRFAASLGLLRLVRPASLLMLVKSTSAIRRKLFLGSRFRSFCDCMPWLEAIVAQARIPTVGFCACPCSLAQGDVIQ